MDTKLYYLRAQVVLTPVYHSEAPEIVVQFNKDIIYQGVLECEQCFNIIRILPADHQKIIVKFLNKKDSDTDLNKGLDKAVIIKQIKFNNINSPRFVWAGEYRPCYPEPWASEQVSLGQPLDSVLISHNYLSWNGIWSLSFTTPIFTWIHHVENLGWIYN